MGTSDLPEMYTQSLRCESRGLRAYISGKSRVPMLQLICNTSIMAYSLNFNMSGITGFAIYACLKDSIMVRQQVRL